ncbi:MAG: HAMP domain-containing sensor histidine kinase [Archangium sp.]|nr:HAMP domain-containing sensor histidine kinase [Archangium sp.]MDP3569438.1 HAMP domain-containing sensor histidine kinase [Archangium sp.]
MLFRSRLATRLSLTHGVLVALLVALFAVTLQGLLRMHDVMTMISTEKFSALDAEEGLHRAAWNIELAVRHGRIECSEGVPQETVRQRVLEARQAFSSVVSGAGAAAPRRLKDAAVGYGTFADEALKANTCAFLVLNETDRRRARLDEEMTNAWIDRLHELHTDIEAKEQTVRTIGRRTTSMGLAVALLGALTAVVVVRWTARSIATPVARLAADATRLGEGNFAPIAPVDGPMEIEELRRHLERTREKLLEVDRLKQSFLASVSHELRSPLGRLRQALSLLADGTVGELSERQSRVLSLAWKACEQEVRIVEALLDMSRVSSGMPVQKEAGCDLERVVQAAVRSETDVAQERGVELRVVTQVRPPSLRLDSALIERTVANLIRNAISVSPKSSEVKVVIGVNENGPGRVARVDVVDCGPGLSAEVESRLFRPFSAANVEGAARPAGIGLGLSLAREVARAHGGELGVSREAGLTTFRLELPVEHEQPRPETPS